MATLFDDGKGGIETVGQLARFFGKAFIGGDNGEIVQFFFHEVTRQDDLRGEFVDGDIEEALDLARVHVHGQDAMRSGDGDTVGDEACGNGNTWLIFFIGAAIGIVGNNGGGKGGRGRIEGGDHDEEVYGRAGVGGAGRVEY